MGLLGKPNVFAELRYALLKFGGDGNDIFLVQ